MIRESLIAGISRKMSILGRRHGRHDPLHARKRESLGMSDCSGGCNGLVVDGWER